MGKSYAIANKNFDYDVTELINKLLAPGQRCGPR
ncbi:hypothetical protein Corgl_1683 [Coriobacterium glomerans PW2]|uniref:Uncharacterized protein n=1 Tax=Coriobacterium glomerans (strain ATCC 49209 / DSM 20642 / JCM 10262 / PW2) TaxID=700015 RepID=F2NB30_CORGP|nr:hypothetical protein Corgl_1683 [Coriobacterium glomerans PW2]